MVAVPPLLDFGRVNRNGLTQLVAEVDGLGDVFDHDRGFEGLFDGFAPGEDAVVAEEDGGAPTSILQDCFTNMVTFVIDVGRARNFSAELITNCGENAGD